MRRVLPILAATVLVACGGTTTDGASDVSTNDVPAATTTTTTKTPVPTPTPTARADASGGSNSDIVVPAALQFSAPLVGGGEIELGPLAGRPVLLWFWAPW
jgi:hypothetical protein